MRTVRHRPPHVAALFLLAMFPACGGPRSSPEGAVQEFLANQAANIKHLRPFVEEISRLEIEDVSLWRASTPASGMIYFKGPDQFRLWRCDYVEGKPRGLGFDD